MIEKQATLKSSTFGGLVTVLEKSSVHPLYVSYLRGVNECRKRFVHHLFWTIPTPGELKRYNYPRALFAEEVFKYGRRFAAAHSLLPGIFVRSGLLKGETIGDGILLSNVGFFNSEI